MTSFKTYLDTYYVGMKELNSMLSSRITQLRSNRTKTIYQYFHNSILPAMSVIDPKIFKAIVKSLSQLYRNKDIDVEETLVQIEPLLIGGGLPSIPEHKTHPTIDTTVSKHIPEKEVPESPSHKVVQRKKKMMKKCVKSPMDKIETVKQLVMSLNQESDTE